MADLRGLSKAVFGNQYRLEVLAWIAASDGRFYQREIADALGIPDPTVAPILKHLEHAGLVSSIERLRANGPRFFERKQHPLWFLASDLVASEQSVPARAR